MRKDIFYTVMPRFGTNRSGIFELVNKKLSLRGEHLCSTWQSWQNKIISRDAHIGTLSLFSMTILKLSYSDLFRVSIDPRGNPEGDRKESVPEGDERGRKPEGNNHYIVMPRFGTNRQGIFEFWRRIY